MQKKIFYSIFASCLGMLIVGNIFLIFALEAFFTKEVFNELKKEARLLSGLGEHLFAFKASDLPYLDSHRITIVDSSGNVLYDTFVPMPVENHSKREEIFQAFKNGEAFSSRFSQTTKKNFLYYAFRVQILDKIYVIRVSTAKNDVLSLLFSILPWIVLEIMLCLVLCLVLARYLTGVILRPLDHLDMKSLKKDLVYQELHAFIDRIKTQNKTIKNQMKKIKQKQQEFLVLIENMSDGLILINEKGKVISFNKSSHKTFSNLDQIARVNQIGDELFLKKVLFLLQVFERQHSFSHLECFPIDAQEYEVIFSPIYRKSKLKGMVIVLRGLTMEQEMQKLRREFSANVTHELKTPLTSILASSEMIKNQLVPTKDLPGFIERIHQESRRLLVMIEEILKLSFFDENGNHPTQKTKVSLKELIFKVVNRLELLAKEKQISFELDLEECLILGVEQFMENLIYNLCDNAIKYNKIGGVVKISLKSTADKIVLRVADNGIGIPKQDQHRIFERFYCVDKSRSKQLGGTGLGLSIVKSIANYHQAKIEVFAEENGGSVFQIVFPKLGA